MPHAASVTLQPPSVTLETPGSVWRMLSKTPLSMGRCPRLSLSHHPRTASLGAALLALLPAARSPGQTALNPPVP